MNNLVILTGNLGYDPDIRYTSKGLAIAKMYIAVKEFVKRDDESKEVTSWIRVRVLGNQAEKIGNTLTKGSEVQVIGSWRNDNWEDEKGRHKLDYVLARRVRFLTIKKAS